MSGDISESAVRTGLAVGLGAFALTLAVVVLVFGLRWAQARRDARTERMRARWLPILLECLVGQAPSALPPVARREARDWLRMWVATRGAVRGEAAESLNAAMRATGIDAICRRWLSATSPQARLVATIALGFLGDDRDWAALRARFDDELPIIGISAASALVRIDPSRGVPLLLDVAPTRSAWHGSRVLRVLRDAGADAVTDVLCAWLRGLPVHTIAGSIPYLAAAHSKQAQELIVSLLDNEEFEVLCACLRLVDSPRALARIRALTAHGDWRVRLHAASALGRLGDLSDWGRFLTLLGDQAWWVRMRAARALMALPGVERGLIEDLSRRHPDAYARDMLVEALAREH